MNKNALPIGLGLALIVLGYFAATAGAVGTKGATNISRPVKMTILRCGTGRMRSLKTVKAKCTLKQKQRLRNTRGRKSAILKRAAPRYRPSTRASKRPVRRKARLSGDNLRWLQLKARQRRIEREK